jgi:hypothetical protein
MKNNYLMDLDTVTITTYSLSGSKTPEKATLIIKANIDSIFSSLTKFNIISDASLKPEVYELSDNVTEIDRNGVLGGEGYTLVFIKTNLVIENLIITSKFCI